MRPATSFIDSSSPVKRPQFTPSQFSEVVVQDSLAAYKIRHQYIMSSGSPKGSLELMVKRYFAPFLSTGTSKPGSSSASSALRSSSKNRKSSVGIPTLFPDLRHIATPLWRTPGTLSLSLFPRAERSIATRSTPMGQACSQRPQRVQTQGNLESINSCSIPNRTIRTALRTSIPSTPVTGHPPAHVPQVRHRSAYWVASLCFSRL